MFIKTFMLLATVINPNVNTNDSYVIDYNLTDSDCVAVMSDVLESDGLEIEPGIIFATDRLGLECVAEFAIPPCATEDSDFCAWDATTRGNGLGRSFISWEGEVYFTN